VCCAPGAITPGGNPVSSMDPKGLPCQVECQPSVLQDNMLALYAMLIPRPFYAEKIQRMGANVLCGPLALALALARVPLLVAIQVFASSAARRRFSLNSVAHHLSAIRAFALPPVQPYRLTITLLKCSRAGLGKIQHQGLTGPQPRHLRHLEKTPWDTRLASRCKRRIARDFIQSQRPPPPAVYHSYYCYHYCCCCCYHHHHHYDNIEYCTCAAFSGVYPPPRPFAGSASNAALTQGR
jgi:hypothetical protein